MNIKRRSVLKGMALGGLAGLSLGRTGLSSAGTFAKTLTRKPLLVLVSSAEAEAPFAAGVQANPAATVATVLRTDHGLEFISALQRQLNASNGERIIGLVDDASGALILDLARSAGARLHWSGQHVTEGDHSRHRLSATLDVINCIGQFAALTNDCSRPSSLPQQTLTAGRQWAGALGFSLSSPNPGRRYLRATPPVAAAALGGHYVSFFIET